MSWVPQETIADAGVIQLAVRSLARDVGESRQGVALLLELSKSPRVCEEIGRAQSSILLLVTMLNSENQNAVKDSKLVLAQLASNDQNVVQMAEANHFRPLADRLNSGGWVPGRYPSVSGIPGVGWTQDRSMKDSRSPPPSLIRFWVLGLGFRD